MSDDLTLRLRQARIPLIAHKKKLADFDGQVIETYILSKQYNLDRVNGMGAVIIGEDPRADQLLQVMARAAVVAGDYTAYTSLQTLMFVATTDDHPAFELFDSCQALYVEGFHDSSIEIPLSKNEQFMVEGFLRKRTTAGLRNYYVVEKSFDDAAGWWSKKFIVGQKIHLRELHI